MRVAQRVLGTLLLVAFAVAPLGVAAEGYVCGFSGKRMTHVARVSTAMCAHCGGGAGAPVAGGAAIERPCCVYVGSTALPPTVGASSARALPDLRPMELPRAGGTAPAGAPVALNDAPHYESGGTGVSPPPLELRPANLKN